MVIETLIKNQVSAYWHSSLLRLESQQELARIHNIINIMAKYGQVAERNGLRFIPAVFSHTGQIHEAFKTLDITMY